jgi:hypothetical protein
MQVTDIGNTGADTEARQDPRLSVPSKTAVRRVPPNGAQRATAVQVLHNGALDRILGTAGHQMPSTLSDALSF